MSENEINLKTLLNKKLTIPEYQRPYEWEKSNVYILLEDIIKSYKENLEINLGTIIIYKNEIVDGQQRIITLSLLLKVLNPEIKLNIFKEKLLCISSTKQKILKNYFSIKKFIERLEKKDNLDKESFNKYLKNKVKFYLLKSKTEKEAFQLFDGRNSKYKDLTPVDLLKAFHLGKIPDDDNLKRDILEKWKKNMEGNFKGIDNSMSRNEYIFNCMLFNIYNWSLNKKSNRAFSKNDIYLYKGYDDEDEYEYVKYYKSRNKDCFQINKPFKAGEEFFKMVEHYIGMLNKIIENKNLLDKIEFEDKNNYHFRYINYIYYGGILYFYDKFGEGIPDFYKETIIEYIYRWSIYHRMKNKQVNLESINKYVIESDYNFFFECNNALEIKELFKMEVICDIEEPSEKEKLGKLRRYLWNELNYIED